MQWSSCSLNWWKDPIGCGNLMDEPFQLRCNSEAVFKQSLWLEWQPSTCVTPSSKDTAHYTSVSLLILPFLSSFSHASLVEMGRWSLVKLLRLFPDCTKKDSNPQNRPYQWHLVVSCNYSSHFQMIHTSCWFQFQHKSNTQQQQLCLHSENHCPHMKVLLSMLLWIREGTPSISRLLIMNEAAPKIRISHLTSGVSLWRMKPQMSSVTWSQRFDTSLDTVFWTSLLQ